MLEKLIFKLVSIVPSLFSIGSSLFLQVRRPTIKSQMGSKFGQIRTRTAELAALERLKKSHRLKIGEILIHSDTFIFDWSFFILADREGNHKSLDEFEFQPDSTTDCVNCLECLKNQHIVLLALK